MNTYVISDDDSDDSSVSSVYYRAEEPIHFMWMSFMQPPNSRLVAWVPPQAVPVDGWLPAARAPENLPHPPPYGRVEEVIPLPDTSDEESTDWEDAITDTGDDLLEGGYCFRVLVRN